MSFVRPLATTGLLALAAAWTLAANAQVYRIVGPDGRVTFSDRPPPADVKATAAPVVPMQGGGADLATGLPFELRTTASRYPVTLYSGTNCAPCDASRNFLATRGIPFTEKTVTTAEDAEALQRLSGSQTLPFATIGSQQLKGFSEAEWGQFLDAAGYPKTSQLPAGYRRPPASPLVVATRPAAAEQAARPASAPQRAAQQPSTGPGPSNPAGIQF